MTDTTAFLHTGSCVRYFRSRLIAAALTLTLFMVPGCKTAEDQVQNPRSRPVKITTVSRDTGMEQISLPGKTRASRRVDLSFKVSGPLVELMVEEGQKVGKGQVIARIDPRDFKTRVSGIRSALSEARATLRSMEKGAREEDLRMLESALEAARAEYVFAEDLYLQSKQLWEKKYISRIDFNRHTSQRDMAKARFKAAKQDLVKGRNGARVEDIEAMESRIKGLAVQGKAARDALDDTFLRAPFSGYVAKRYVENHQKVRAKQPIVLLVDISEIEIVVDVPETLMAAIHKTADARMSARLTVAPDQRFSLIPKEYSIHADPQTQTYAVVLTMPQPENITILPGMTAIVENHPDMGAPEYRRIIIPAAAVTRDSEKTPFVWQLDEKKMTVAKTRVRIGKLTGSQDIVILEGLLGGEKIVTAGAAFLRAGMKVRVWEGMN